MPTIPTTKISPPLLWEISVGSTKGYLVAPGQPINGSPYVPAVPANWRLIIPNVPLLANTDGIVELRNFDPKTPDAESQAMDAAGVVLGQIEAMRMELDLRRSAVTAAIDYVSDGQANLPYGDNPAGLPYSQDGAR